MFIALLFVLTVLSPIAFWLWFFIWQDRFEPEPRRLLTKIFFLGIGVSIFAIAVEGTILSLIFPQEFAELMRGGILETTETFSLNLAAAFFLAGAIEEVLKLLALIEFVYSDSRFNQIADGILYGVTLALGFSIIENSLYFFGIYGSATTMILIGVAVLRGIATTLLHVTSTGIIGFGLGKMKFSVGHKRVIMLKALGLAVLIHGLFNLLILIPVGILFAFPLVFTAFIFILLVLSRPQTRLVWKLENKPRSLEKQDQEIKQ